MNHGIVNFFDLEMCCWNDGRKPSTGEIIEFSLVKADIFKKEIIKRSQYYVLPEKDEISDYCVDLTGITQGLLNKQGRPLADVVESVRENFGWHGIYGAWGRDNNTLRMECDQKGIAMPFYEYVNIKTVWQWSTRRRKKGIGQRKAMELAGLDFEGRQHSGLADAENLARFAMTFM